MGERRMGKSDRSAIAETASSYVVRLSRGASDAERAEIEAWIDADPAHAVGFARMQAAWDATERLRAHPVGAVVAASTTSGRPSRRAVAFSSAAACGSAVVAGTVLWAKAQGVRVSTGVGERRSVRLADGSTIDLNTASAVEAKLTHTRRDVRLVRGEAHFDVAHDARRPFYVTASAARLRAVGTAFDVRMRDALVELTVTQGVVAVEASRTSAARDEPVAAGQGAVIRSGAVVAATLDAQALNQRTAWRRGVIDFEGETLAQAVEEFNRYQPHPIVLADPRLAGLRLGGRFRTDEAAAFLRAVSSSFPIDVIPTNDGGCLLAPRPRNSPSRQ